MARLRAVEDRPTMLPSAGKVVKSLRKSC